MRLSFVSKPPSDRPDAEPIISRLRDAISADVGRLRSREHALKMEALQQAAAQPAAIPPASEAADAVAEPEREERVRAAVAREAPVRRSIETLLAAEESGTLATAAGSPVEREPTVKTAVLPAAKPMSAVKAPAARKGSTAKVPKAAKTSTRAKAARAPRAKVGTVAQKSKRPAKPAAGKKPAKVRAKKS